MSKQCRIIKKVANNGYSISHSHIRNRRKQFVNLKYKKIWSKSKLKWIKLRVSVKFIKSQHKKLYKNHLELDKLF